MRILKALNECIKVEQAGGERIIRFDLSTPFPEIRKQIESIWKHASEIDIRSEAFLPSSFLPTLGPVTPSSAINRLALVSDRIFIEDPLGSVLMPEAIVDDKERAAGLAQTVFQLNKVSGLVDAGVVQMMPPLEHTPAGEFLERATDRDTADSRYLMRFATGTKLEEYRDKWMRHVKMQHPDMKSNEVRTGLRKMAVLHLSRETNSMLFCSDAFNLVPTTYHEELWDSYNWKIATIGRTYKANASDSILNYSLAQLPIPAVDNASSESILRRRRDAAGLSELRAYLWESVKSVRDPNSAKEGKEVLDQAAANIEKDMRKYQQEAEVISKEGKYDLAKTTLPFVLGLVLSASFGSSLASISSYAASLAAGASSVGALTAIGKGTLDWRKEQLIHEIKNKPVSMLLRLKR